MVKINKKCLMTSLIVMHRLNVIRSNQVLYNCAMFSPTFEVADTYFELNLRKFSVL